MQPFELVQIQGLAGAQHHVSKDPIHRLFRAGGIDLLDRMKEGLDAPAQLVELRRVVADDQGSGDAETPGGVLTRTDINPEAGITVGALITLNQLAEANLSAISRDFDAIAALQEAAGQAATPSIRNTATVGGNLLQRPRCWYFRNRELVCLKKGGDTCLAVSGDNRYHAILGGGPSYIVHPSSLATPLTALRAEVIISGRPSAGAEGVDDPFGERAPQRRQIPIGELFVSPTEDASREHRLADGEVLVGVFIPPAPSGTTSAYEAAREKQSHDWPLAEAAVSLRVVDGKISAPRVAIGHVAPIPWHAGPADDVLDGQRPSAELFERAAIAATAPAKALASNGYKIPLVQGLIRKALHRAAGVPLPA